MAAKPSCSVEKQATEACEDAPSLVPGEDEGAQQFQAALRKVDVHAGLL